MQSSQQTRRGRESGIALIIVLAFVVLLSGLVVAYLLRSTSDQQSANGTLNQTKADQLAISAINVVIGDLRQELVAGSTASTVSGTTIYTPTQPSFILPVRSGNPPGSPDPIPNLVRRSVRNDPIASPGVGSRASASNSTTDLSQNGRSISLKRWNKHYLVPRISGASPTDTTPIASFTAPDWILVTSSGPDATATQTSGVLGRYAFAIYDEGGLIDANVGGYPPSPNTSLAQSGPKGLLSFADLTLLGMSTSAVDDLVGWRNYATAQPSGSFGSFSFSVPKATNYFNAVTLSSNDFLKISPTVSAGRTDQKFVNRQTLIQYRSAGGINFSADAMQYLGTFSRELNIATWNNLQIQRFPISKLNEVSPSGDAAKVRSDFGLVWNTDHWDYYGRGGSSLANSIGPFVASNPEFFQLLNVAIPGRTVGEILAIGASIIDQNDADSTTTIIEYSAGVPPNPRAYGVELVAAPSPAPSLPPSPIVLNRPLRSAGELGYAYKNVAANQTLNFTVSPAPDSGVLDLFSYTDASVRAGSVNLNTRNSPVIEALLGGAIESQPSSVPTTARRRNAAAGLVAATTAAPASSRQDLARLTQSITGVLGGSEENKEMVSRAMSDVCQTRTWGLMVDVIAQSGRFPPNATSLAQFVVEGEKRYWLHIAIDRFTGQVIDQQLEAVYE
jgi:hypothetical protein